MNPGSLLNYLTYQKGLISAFLGISFEEIILKNLTRYNRGLFVVIAIFILALFVKCIQRI